MSKNKNMKTKIRIPRNLIYIGSITLTLLVIFFTWFGIQYSANHVDPFAEDLAEVEVKRIKPKQFTDFTFDFYTSDFMASTATTAKFMITTYDKAPDIGRVSEVKVKIILAANWIGYTSNTASNSSIPNSDKWWDSSNYDATDEDEDDPYDKVKVEMSITSIKETFPKKSFFLGMKIMPKAYVWLSYTLTKNGKATPKNYLIEYSYSDYFTSLSK